MRGDGRDLPATNEESIDAETHEDVGGTALGLPLLSRPRGVHHAIAECDEGDGRSSRVVSGPP